MECGSNKSQDNRKANNLGVSPANLSKMRLTWTILLILLIIKLLFTVIILLLFLLLYEYVVLTRTWDGEVCRLTVVGGAAAKKRRSAWSCSSQVNSYIIMKFLTNEQLNGLLLNSLLQPVPLFLLSLTFLKTLNHVSVYCHHL